MAVKECPKCKESNKAEAKTCFNCGTSLVNVELKGMSEDDKKSIYGNFDFALKNRFCPSCEKYYEKKYTQCPNCGTLLEEKTEKVYYAVPKSSGGNIGIYILSFLIPIAGLIIGAIWLANGKSDGGVCIALSIAGMIFGGIGYGLLFT